MQSIDSHEEIILVTNEEKNCLNRKKSIIAKGDTERDRLIEHGKL